MRYSLHEIDKHEVVATTVAVDPDEALEWFSEKLRLMLTFEGDHADAEYLLDEWPEGMLARCEPHHSGFRSERNGCTSPGIARRWMWSDRYLARFGWASPLQATGHKMLYTPAASLDSSPCRPTNTVARNAGRSSNAPRPSPSIKP
jgi:hypothetical protein